MGSLINQATIKVRRDTASNWTSNNPTPNQGEICMETDTGNIKIGDGSTAWTSLAYYVPKTLPYDYDISSADQTHTLPAITGAPQEVEITWSGGDGTYDLTIYESDGTTALDYKGEGEGHIRIVSTGSAWKVVDYEDSGKRISGTETTGFVKNLNGRRRQWMKKTGLGFGSDTWTMVYRWTLWFPISGAVQRSLDYRADRPFDIYIHSDVTTTADIYGHRSVSGAGTLYDLFADVWDEWK